MLPRRFLLPWIFAPAAIFAPVDFCGVDFCAGVANRRNTRATLLGVAVGGTSLQKRAASGSWPSDQHTDNGFRGLKLEKRGPLVDISFRRGPIFLPDCRPARNEILRK